MVVLVISITYWWKDACKFLFDLGDGKQNSIGIGIGIGIAICIFVFFSFKGLSYLRLWKTGRVLFIYLLQKI